MRKQHDDDTYEPEMPETGAAYLIGFLWEIGPTMSGGMGPAPLSHGEIESWQRNVGITLRPWEARFLRRLSLEYISESYSAEKRDCPPPWSSTDEVALSSERAAVAKDMKSSIRRLAAL